MEKVFELDQKKVNKEAFLAAGGLGLFSLYALIIFLCGFNFDFFFMLLVLNSQSNSQRKLFVDFEKVILSEEEISLGNGKSLAWSEIDWSISYVSESFISLRSLDESWKCSLLISPQYFINAESLVHELNARRDVNQRNTERRVYFQQDSFQSMKLPFQIFWYCLFLLIILALMVESSQSSSVKATIDLVFVLLSLYLAYQNKDFNKETVGNLNPISVSDIGIFLDDSHSIAWGEIDWQKSRMGLLRTKLVRKEAWKNKVTFWSLSYSKELREEILLKRSLVETSNQAVVS